MKPFNQNDILRLAGSSSFTKGEDYYNNGYVCKITKTGNKFKGNVEGTSVYSVTLDVSGDIPDFKCSCPYSFGGICKHSVALGLAVLDGKYEEKPVAKPDNKQENPGLFKECYKNADTSKKLDFLKQLLDKDTDLQSQFVVFTQNKAEKPDAIVFTDIDKVSSDIREELSSIDFDDIVESYNPYDEGYYDDEGYYEDVDAAIENVFTPYTVKAKEFFRKGNLIDGTRVIIGMYEGTMNLEEPENNYYLFEDGYEEKVFGIFKLELKEIVSGLEQIIKSDEQVFRVFDLLFQRFEMFKIQEIPEIDNDEEEDDDDEKDVVVEYNVKIFESLLIALSTNKETTEYLYCLIQKHSFESVEMAYVLLRIAEITSDEQLWIGTAEKFAAFESDISKQLLEKYKLKNETGNFNRIADVAFGKWADTFSLYLIDNIDKESNNALYLKALRRHTSHAQSVKHYKILREYLSESERIGFVNSVGSNYNSLFYVQLLEIEKRYADILAVARKHSDMYSDYEKVLLPIANIYPQECFEIIKGKCDAALKSYKKDRHTYQRITKLLNVMILITTMQNEVRAYIQSLYNYKPNLPALKDEMRKGKLV